MPEYIEREKTLKKIKGSISEVFNIASNAGRMYQKITEIVESVLAADVAPVRHGKIVETIENGRAKRVFTCCGEDFTQLTQWYMPKYCPHCGALMGGGKDDG